jgi:hypothetical protein
MPPLNLRREGQVSCLTLLLLVSLAGYSTALAAASQADQSGDDLESETTAVTLLSANPVSSRAFFQVGADVQGLLVYDMRGRMVRWLPVDGGSAQWDRRDKFGSVVSSGSYIVVPDLSKGSKLKEKLKRRLFVTIVR